MRAVMARRTISGCFTYCNTPVTSRRVIDTSVRSPTICSATCAVRLGRVGLPAGTCKLLRRVRPWIGRSPQCGGDRSDHGYTAGSVTHDLFLPGERHAFHDVLTGRARGRVPNRSGKNVRTRSTPPWFHQICVSSTKSLQPFSSPRNMVRELTIAANPTLRSGSS